jgi:DNA-binding MurR/RpiR family transcriptional regulator
MNILEYIKERKDDFSASECKVLEVVLNTPHYVETDTITKLAERADTSTSAVLRFCHTLGYKGYKDFRYAFSQALRKINSESNIDAISQSLDQSIKILENLKSFPKESVIELAHAIKDSQDIHIIGFHYSSLPAMKLSMMLEDMGIPSYSSYNNIHALHHANTISESSLFILFTYEGNEKTFKEMFNSLPVNMTNSFLITQNPNTSLKKRFTKTITLPSNNIQNHLQDRSIAMNSFVEMIIQIIDEL